MNLTEQLAEAKQRVSSYILEFLMLDAPADYIDVPKMDLYEINIRNAIIDYKEYCKINNLSLDDMETKLLDILSTINIEFSR